MSDALFSIVMTIFNSKSEGPQKCEAHEFSMKTLLGWNVPLIVWTVLFIYIGNCINARRPKDNIN